MTRNQRKDLHHRLRTQARVEIKAWALACFALIVFGIMLN